MNKSLPALLSTLHDPQGRLLPALQERGEHLAWYAAVYVTVTDATHPALREALAGQGAGGGAVAERGGQRAGQRVHVIGGPNAQVGAARRLALRTAFQAGEATFLYCDFDRWLHWVGRFPEELRDLPAALAGRRPRPWYACLGRTRRAFATHPYVQRVAEGATNRAASLALGRRLDATAGACWLDRRGAEIVLAGSVEETNATDLEWPALVNREAGRGWAGGVASGRLAGRGWAGGVASGRLAGRRRVAYVATEGLEFETAEFYAPEIAALGGREAWERAHYERPEVWRARLGLATDSVTALCRVLG
jgi:hypothetical protein